MGPTRITRLTRCLSDGGNQYSFVSSDLVSSLKLPVISTRPLELEVFESSSSFSQTQRQVRFQLSSIWDNLKNVVNSEPPVKVSDSLTLITSIFGCILSGPRSHATVSFIPIVHNINVDTSIQELDDVVREIWILESIDVQPVQEEIKHLSSTLNDALEIGPYLLPGIMATLLRFCLSKIATWQFIASQAAWREGWWNYQTMSAKGTQTSTFSRRKV
ncbi:DUF1758 domain-containing protein [Nephila pilipes]|uniref:DUF1758 domain-containing protein n=1 Tax=Nephila pilipes TaxID=299642 RepID=A0A8X6NYB8_NEPPI|nr:DUF1758 domain-containing protein [Nephila pilipes]